MIDRRLLQNFDWILLLIIMVIAAISLLNLFSATYALGESGGSQVFTKQLYWFMSGLIVLLIMTLFDYHLIERLAYPFYAFAIVLLILVLVIGNARSGSQRWLTLAGISLQPSELAKMAAVIVLAKFFNEHGEVNDYRLKDLWLPFLLIAVPCGLILVEPDLGTALILLIVSASIFLFMGIHRNTLILLLLIGFSAAPFGWFSLKEYQQKRIITFLKPDKDPLGAGYHLNQSKIAIGSGQLWGKGYLKGTQTRLRFLPEQHTDFAFSVLAEEWGLAGSMVLLLLYLLLILWGINIAKISKDRFGAIIALGIIAFIFWQLIINISMITGLMPVVGIPLAMMSYGGSSTITTMAGMGLLMNISMRRFMFQ